MNAVVFLKDGEARASSRDVAAAFEKAHRAVLYAIDKLIALRPDLSLHNFVQREFIQDGVAGKPHRYFEMNRDGFTLLAMGFTGAKALDWKIRFIEAFNAMEAALRTRPANDDLAARPGRKLDLREALGTIDERHAIKTALLTVQMYTELYGQQVGREMMERLGFPTPGVELPAPQVDAGTRVPAEGDIHQWSVAVGLTPSRRGATHQGELYESYSRWCGAQGVAV